jgi:hypothetical protein
VIRIADFVIASDGTPSLQNIETYNPGKRNMKRECIPCFVIFLLFPSSSSFFFFSFLKRTSSLKVVLTHSTRSLLGHETIPSFTSAQSKELLSSSAFSSSYIFFNFPLAQLPVSRLQPQSTLPVESCSGRKRNHESTYKQHWLCGGKESRKFSFLFPFSSEFFFCLSTHMSLPTDLLWCL